LDKSGSPDELKKAFERNYSKNVKAKNKELNQENDLLKQQNQNLVKQV